MCPLLGLNQIPHCLGCLMGLLLTLKLHPGPSCPGPSTLESGRPACSCSEEAGLTTVFPPRRGSWVIRNPWLVSSMFPDSAETRHSCPPPLSTVSCVLCGCRTGYYTQKCEDTLELRLAFLPSEETRIAKAWVGDSTEDPQEQEHLHRGYQWEFLQPRRREANRTAQMALGVDLA